MHFLGCLFALFLGLIIIAAVFIGSVIDFILAFLGLKKRGTAFGGQSPFGTFRQGPYDNQDPSAGTRQQTTDGRQQAPHHSTGQQSQKIFQKDDSEYVDFEEV